MKRKIGIATVCALLVVIATSPIASAAELFGVADADVLPGDINISCTLLHFDTDEQEDVDPEWEWNDQTEMWEMDWTQNPPANIPIESEMVINDLCNPLNKMYVSIEAELTVARITPPQNAWDDSWTSPGFPNSVEFDGSGMPPKYSTFLGPINVAGNQGHDYEVTVTLKIWDHDDTPPTLYSEDIVGVIYT